jgi:hypothetical protein
VSLARRTSWKCACGVTVERSQTQFDEDDEPLMVELDGVVHTCNVEDDDDY